MEDAERVSLKEDNIGSLLLWRMLSEGVESPD
jgi:hypothetical protein